MRHPAYSEYKESGVQWLGQVPGHWEVKRARFMMRVNPPAPILRKLEEDQEISFVPMDAVNEYGGIRLDQARVKAEVGGGYTEFQNGDVVIAKITPCFENGKGSIATDLVNSAAYGTTELHVLRASQALDYRFLFYLTITDGYRKLGESEMYGAGGQKRVPPEFCKDFLTPTPPLPEQTAIADFLDRETGRIDTLVVKKRRLIALLKEKRTALISRTVTRGLPAHAAREFGLEPHTRFKDSCIEWLGQVPEGWEVWKYAHLFRSSMGQTILKEDVSDDGPIPVLSATEKYEIFGYLEHSSVILDPGDLVIPARGNSIGHVKLVRERCTTTQTTIFSKHLTTKVVPVFAFYYLIGYRGDLFQFDRTAIPQLTVNQVSTNPFLLPPSSEQTAIATYLDRETARIDKLVEKVEAAIVSLQEYRTALITAAVTGKIDVREAVNGVDRVDEVTLEVGCGG